MCSRLNRVKKLPEPLLVRFPDVPDDPDEFP